jgi:MFS family permease
MATAPARSASAFHSSAFTRFYTGQALSYLGDGLRTLAIPLLVFRLTGSAIAVGTTWGLELLPYALVSLIGGSLADRVDRRRLMLTCDALRFVVMACLALLLWTHHLSIGMVYAGVLVLAVGGSIFLGAQQTSLPFLLGPEGVKSGVAALQATEQIVGLIAPAVGGAMMGILGPLPALIANAATYLGSQAAIASVRSFGPDKPAALPSPRAMGADIALGWRFLIADRSLRELTLLHGASNFVGAIGGVTLIPYFKRAFDASDASIGVAFGAMAAAAAVGSVIAGRTHWRFGRAVIVAALADGFAYLSLPIAPLMIVAVIGAMIASGFSGYRVTALVAWRLRVVPHDLVGRVFGVIKCIVLGGILPGALLGGYLADHLGVRPTQAISGLTWLAAAILIASRRDIREEAR